MFFFFMKKCANCIRIIRLIHLEWESIGIVLGHNTQEEVFD
jgi:hypothetical protein